MALRSHPSVVAISHTGTGNVITGTVALQQATGTVASVLTRWNHYSDVIMGSMASQIISLTIVYLTVYSGGDQRKYQSSTSLVCRWGIHRWPVNSPHKRPVTRKMFPFDDRRHHDNRNFDGLVQDCSNSSALVLALLQFCAKQSTGDLIGPW